MALKEIPLSGAGSEQLSFTAFELADAVAHLLRVRAQKKEANDDFNTEIKAIEKHIVKLSNEIQAAKK
jgi:hypothetical protein